MLSLLILAVAAVAAVAAAPLEFALPLEASSFPTAPIPPPAVFAPAPPPAPFLPSPVEVVYPSTVTLPSKPYPEAVVVEVPVGPYPEALPVVVGPYPEAVPIVVGPYPEAVIVEVPVGPYADAIPVVTGPYPEGAVVVNPAAIFDPVSDALVLSTGTRVDVRDEKGQFSAGYAAPDGTQVSEEGRLITTNGGWEYVIAKTGSYSYVSPEGITVAVNWVADENGFRHVPA